MCDRTKAEILARELCAEYWCGANSEITQDQKLREFAESNWEQWKPAADKLVILLEKHE